MPSFAHNSSIKKRMIDIELTDKEGSCFLQSPDKLRASKTTTNAKIL